MVDFTDVPAGISTSEWVGLQQQFLEEGVARSRDLLTSLDKDPHSSQITQQLHQWAGSGGQLGFHDITELARRAEWLMGELPSSRLEIRERLTDLALAFSVLRDKLMVAVPEYVAQALQGKSVALIGFRIDRANRTCAALGRVGARPRLFRSADDLGYESMNCDMVIIHVEPETEKAKLQAAADGFAAGKLFLTGQRSTLMALPASVQARVDDLLFNSWEDEELLLRLTTAVWRKAAGTLLAPVAPHVVAFQTTEFPRRVTARPRVAVVDDDPIILTLLRATFQNEGMECQVIDNGRDALRLIRNETPHLVVLDINMPGMDGYEVLSAIREEDLPTQVLLLTARQQEHDVLHGFQLGADDYLVKPFNPLELLARVKRLLMPRRRAAA